MPQEYMYPNSTSIAQWNVFLAPTSHQALNEAHPGLPFGAPPAGDPSRIRAISISAQQCRMGMTNLPAVGIGNITSVTMHAEGRDDSSNYAAQLYLNGGWRTYITSGSSFPSGSWGSVNQVAIGFSANINPGTGEGWVASLLNAVDIRHVRGPGNFLVFNGVAWSHLDVDYEEDEGIVAELIGASWLPPLIAAGLGQLLLMYEDPHALQRLFHRVIGGHGGRGVLPLMTNREERERLLGALLRRPRFA